MPNVINNIMSKIWALIRGFFQANDFEFGIIEVTSNGPSDCDKTIDITTNHQVQKVWFQMEPKGMPVCGGGQSCWISEPVITQDGFTFRIKVYTMTCVIRWFAIL